MAIALDRETAGEYSVRLSIDLIATILGFLTGGEVGVMTVLMVLLLAPIVEFVGKLFEKWGVA